MLDELHILSPDKLQVHLIVSLGTGRDAGLMAELQCVFLQSAPLDAENVISFNFSE